MSIYPDGKHRCDNCGHDLDNAGVVNALMVGDLDPHRPGHVRNLEFCRDREEDGEKIKGCAKRLVKPTNMKFYEENRAAEESGAEG